MWLAANIGVIGIVYGAILTSLGLDLWQGVAVATIGTGMSFALVGVLGVAGKWGGAPMLRLSRAPFGRLGNLAPTLMSWISLLGWETVTAVVTAYAGLGLLGTGFGLKPTRAASLALLLAVVLSALLFSRLGHATILVVQRIVSWSFGLLTLAVLPFLISTAHWSSLLSQRPGSWLAVLGGLAIVAAAGGISWANVSADYTRYLPRSERGRAIVGWTTVGSTIPLATLIIVGILLSSAVNGLGGAADPISAIGSVLPKWLAVPYLVAAIGGLLSQLVMGLYSSGLNLLALGPRIRRSRSVLIDATVIMAGGAFFLVANQGFLGTFISFISLLACGIATWAAVFVVDMWLRRGYDAVTLAATGRWHGAALFAWLAGSAVGLLCTASPLFTGPFAVGIFAESSLGYLLGALVSAVLYAVLGRGVRRPPR